MSKELALVALTFLSKVPGVKPKKVEQFYACQRMLHSMATGEAVLVDKRSVPPTPPPPDQSQ